jgi:hypothetical protein
MKIAYLCSDFREHEMYLDGKSLWSRKDSAKGYKMFESEMIEMEDFNFNHLIHHYDDCDCEHMDFNEEFDCIDVLAECAEEILWN